MPAGHLAYLATGRGELVLQAGAEPVRLLLLGGQPLGEPIVMWWNFIGRSHEEIVAYRAAWQAEIGAEPAGPDDAARTGGIAPRFGTFPEGTPDPLPAPVLPAVRLRPRG